MFKHDLADSCLTKLATLLQGLKAEVATDPERIGPGYHCFFSDPDPHVTIKPDPDLIIRISIFKNILAIPIFQTRSVYFSENFGVVTDFSDQRASVTD